MWATVTQFFHREPSWLQSSHYISHPSVPQHRGLTYEMGVGVGLNGSDQNWNDPHVPYLSKPQSLSCCVVRGFSNANGHWGKYRKVTLKTKYSTVEASHDENFKTGLRLSGLVCSWKETMRVEVRNFKAFPLTWVSHGFNWWLTNPLKSAINVTLGWGVPSYTKSHLWSAAHTLICF